MPWGISGGHDGSPNEFFVDKADGTIDGPFGVYPRYPLNKGDVVRLVTGTGGGYGNPLERDAAQVASDVKNDYFTVEEAGAIFGVEVDSDTFGYRELETRKH